jgi:hypothetical protein
LPAGPDLGLITQNLYDYLKQSHAFKADLVQYLKTGELIDLSNHVMGESEAEIQKKVPRMVAILQESLKGRSDHPEQLLIADMAQSFHLLNRKLTCMKNATTIPNGALHVMREWLEFHAEDSQSYIIKELPLTIVSLNPFCDLPPQLADFYPSLRQLAVAGVMQPMTDVLKSVYEFRGNPQISPPSVRKPDNKKGQDLDQLGRSAHPFAEFLVSVLGEKDHSFEKLIPALVRLESLGAWGDFLLVLSSLVDESQEDLKKVLGFLAEESADLGGKSVLDVFLEALTASNPTLLYDLVSSLKPYLDSKDLDLVTSLTTLREAFYINSAHILF